MRSGPPLVLFHGGTGSIYDWTDWVEILRRDYRIVRVDLPAHGLTGRIPDDVYSRPNMVAFLEEFFAELDLDQFVLAGNSMGGGVSTLYTLDHPERVKGLVLVAAGGTVPRSAPQAVAPPVTAPRWPTR